MHSDAAALARSIAARNNWKRIALRASAKSKYYNFSARNPNVLDKVEKAELQPMDINDIPYADISPGRPQLLSKPLLPAPLQLNVVTAMNIQPTFDESSYILSSPAFLKHRIRRGVDASSTHFFPRTPPPTQLATNATQSQPQRQSFASTTMPALQLFNLSNAATAAAGLNTSWNPGMMGGGGGGVAGSTSADVLDLKLRRRYAHEWEFLATVLDRVLLIVFSGLVALVTTAMLVIGEAIHLSYNLQEEQSEGIVHTTPTITPPTDFYYNEDRI